MKRFLPVLISILLAGLLPLQVQARNTVPVENIERVAIHSSSGKALTGADVKQAIATAADKNDWVITSATDGKTEASLEVRAKHTIRVEILYDAASYSINYKDSVNMKYETKDGKPYIHPFYNKWVGVLKNSIDQELSKF